VTAIALSGTGISLARRAAMARSDARIPLETVGNGDHGSAGLMLVLCGDENNRPHHRPRQLGLISQKCRLDAARLWYAVPDRLHRGTCLGGRLPMESGWQALPLYGLYLGGG